MALEKSFTKFAWKTKPSLADTITTTNLDKVSTALDIIDNRVIAVDTAVSDNLASANTGLGTKVDKVDGKGLSANDFTDAYKTQVDLSMTATPVLTLTDATAIAWDTSFGYIAKVTLGESRTLSSPTNLKSGSKYLLQVTQDSTGSRTLTYGSAFRFPGGVSPTLTSTASCIDLLEFVCIDGSSLLLTNFVPNLKVVV